MRTDCVLHGGDGGVAAGVVAAGAGGDRGHVGAVRVDFELHVRNVLRIQRAFASIRLQELAHRYSSCFLYQISHHYLYVPFYLTPSFLELKFFFFQFGVFFFFGNGIFIFECYFFFPLFKYLFGRETVLEAIICIRPNIFFIFLLFQA